MMLVAESETINIGRAHTGFQFAADEVDVMAMSRQRSPRTCCNLLLSCNVPFAFLIHANIGVETIPCHGMRHIARLGMVYSLQKNIFIHTTYRYKSIVGEADGCGTA